VSLNGSFREFRPSWLALPELLRPADATDREAKDETRRSSPETQLSRLFMKLPGKRQSSMADKLLVSRRNVNDHDHIIQVTLESSGATRKSNFQFQDEDSHDGCVPIREPCSTNRQKGPLLEKREKWGTPEIPRPTLEKCATHHPRNP
jgi:hypothetical protein